MDSEQEGVPAMFWQRQDEETLRGPARCLGADAVASRHLALLTQGRQERQLEKSLATASSHMHMRWAVLGPHTGPFLS